MPIDPDKSLAGPDWPELVRKVRARTPARLLMGRTGAAYRTDTQLDLREAHAAARDAVRTELNMEAAFGSAFVEQWALLEVWTQAKSKDDYLLRPDLGRRFSEASRAELRKRCTPLADIQIAIGDGLSVSAVAAQTLPLLPLLDEGAKARGWKVGQVLVIHYCRVGILNEIGELLSPKIAVLLIGERPGLATAESLSAYMAYQPGTKHTDADRNLISNIHARGVTPQDAAVRILNLAAKMNEARASGCNVREELPAQEKKRNLP